MAGFTITSGKKADIDINTCHINVWALPSLLNRFYYDVGICFNVTKDVDSLDLSIHLPFSCNESYDLTGVLCKAQSASLVFGESVSVDGQSATFKSGQRNTLQYISLTPDCRKVTSLSKEHSECAVKVSRQLVIGECYYIRLRFFAKQLGHSWQDKSSGPFLRNGAIVDLRFLDPRDWTSNSEHKPDEVNWCSLTRLQIFVIVTAAFQMRSCSPPLKYMRSLERDSWSDYLDRQISLRSEKHLIYYWDSGSGGADKPIVSDSPGRFFLDLSRDFGYLRAVNYWRFALVIIVVQLSLPVFASLTMSLWSSEGSKLWEKGSVWIYGLGGFGAISYLVAKVPKIKAGVDKFILFCAKIEKELYRRSK